MKRITDDSIVKETIGRYVSCENRMGFGIIDDAVKSIKVGEEIGDYEVIEVIGLNEIDYVGKLVNSHSQSLSPTSSTRFPE